MEILGIHKIIGNYEKEEKRKKAEISYRQRMEEFNKNIKGEQNEK